MSQSVSASRPVILRRRRVAVVASIVLFVALFIVSPTDGAFVDNVTSGAVGLAMLVTVALLPKAYAKVARMVRNFR